MPNHEIENRISDNPREGSVGMETLKPRWYHMSEGVLPPKRTVCMVSGKFCGNEYTGVGLYAGIDKVYGHPTFLGGVGHACPIKMNTLYSFLGVVKWTPIDLYFEKET